jgi:glycerophosphoryl diester phosphodiesterase
MKSTLIRKHPVIFASGVAAGVGAAAIASMAPRMGDVSVNQRWREFCQYRYAHRGLHDSAMGIPENSLPAFRRACEHGFGSELDVHLTADDRLVVIHDSELLRVTGRTGVVEELTREQLDEYKLAGTDQGIPSLGDVLRIYEWTGEGPMTAPLIIEVKTYCENADLLMSKLMACLDTFDVRYCIESFDPRVLGWLRRNRPEVIRGQLSMNFLQDGASEQPLPLRVGATMLLGDALGRPDFIAYRFEDRDNVAVRIACKGMGAKLVTWTIRSQEDMATSEAEGAPVIFEGFVPEAKSGVVLDQ